MMSYINETDFVVENKKLVYPEIVTEGLQLYYDAKGKRDTDYHRDTMLDMSGNKNHGKLHNFAYEKHSGYKDGLVFDYIDDKLVRPALNLQPDDFTFMLNGNIISFSPDGTVKRVQDGEVVESKGFNLIRNGDFADGLTGWSRSVGNEAVVNGNEVTITTTQSGRFGLYQDYNQEGLKYISAEYYSEDETKTFTLGSSLVSVTIPNGVWTGVSAVNSDKGLIRFYGDSGLDKHYKIRKPILINLTETFGAGNEPTKEQMDEIINRFGSIPNAQDLIDRIEYKGNDLGDMENIIDGLYKTEVLSGEEIYTDKADDAVVHVDIDGKSVGGGIDNLFSKGDFLNWNSSINGWVDDRLRFSSTSAGGVRLNPELFELGVRYSLGFKARLISGEVIGLAGHSSRHTVTGYQDGVSLGTWTLPVAPPQKPLNVGQVYEYRLEITKNEEGDYVYIQPNRSTYGRTYELEIFDIQLNKGDMPLNYNGLKPTPDYPVEIHSLNDFDMVSSVGRRNLIRGTEDNISWWKSGYPNDASERIKGKITVLRDDTTIGTWNTLFENLENGIESIDSDSDYTLSVDLKISHTPIHTGYIDLQFRDITGKIGKTRQTSIHDLPLNEWTRVSVYVPKTQGYVIKTVYSYITGVYPIGTTIEYKDLKLEKGDRSTPWTPSLGYIAENDNHPLIDKINLLLDEPLRSVGDVKDRLFRDSDGLWKIERNVEEVALADLLWSRGSETSGWKQDGITTAFYTYGLARDGNMNQSIAPIVSHFKTYTDNRLVPRDEVGFTTGGVINYSTIRIPKRTITEDTVPSVKLWMQENGVKIQYVTKIPITETLSQNMQDKLNNLRSFEDSNYVYTVLNKTDILPAVTDNLKPTLHTKFLYNNWYKEDRVINNLMIYNRALTNEEMLQNYKTIKRRWGM